MKRKKIGIIGYGVVGKAVKTGFGPYCDIYINDPLYGHENDEKNVFFKESIQELVHLCDDIFVCVPTPFRIKDNEIDADILLNVLGEIESVVPYNKQRPTVIVKSTVIPSVVKHIDTYFDLNIVINPEFLTQADYHHDFVNQKVLILGGREFLCEKVYKLYDQYSICNKEAKVAFCEAEEASLIKYMENSFLAVKNIFLNEFKLFYDRFKNTENDLEAFNNIVDIFHLDTRMGTFPTRYIVPGPDGHLGFGGKCLPKDTRAICSDAKKYGINLDMIETANKKNDVIRMHKDWLTIEGAVT